LSASSNRPTFGVQFGGGDPVPIRAGVIVEAGLLASVFESLRRFVLSSSASVCAIYCRRRGRRQESFFLKTLSIRAEGFLGLLALRE